jgi:uncharacterized membrane protein
MRAPGVADPAAQAALILADPWHLLAVAANTVRDSGGTYAWEFIGRLAWNDVPLPAAYQALAWAAVAASAAASCAGPALARRAVLAAAAIATAGIFALLYMDWTAPGADHVDGVVGRYFLPLALTLGLALPQIRPHASSRWLASALVALMGTTTPAIMLHHIVWHFFLPA